MERKKQNEPNFRIKFEAWELLFELYEMVLDIPEVTVEEEDGG